MRTTFVAASLLVILLPLTVLATSDTINVSVVANIPFSFEVAGKVLPAGSYRIVENANRHSLTIQNRTSNESMLTGYVTRLAMRPSDAGEVVFDVAGSKQYLSEVYIPGIDGFLLQDFPETHTHLVIKGESK